MSECTKCPRCNQCGDETTTRVLVNGTDHEYHVCDACVAEFPPDPKDYTVIRQESRDFAAVYTDHSIKDVTWHNDRDVERVCACGEVFRGFAGDTLNAHSTHAAVEEQREWGPAKHSENRLSDKERAAMSTRIRELQGAWARSYVPKWHDVPAVERSCASVIGCSQADLRDSELDEIHIMVVAALGLVV